MTTQQEFLSQFNDLLRLNKFEVSMKMPKNVDEGVTDTFVKCMINATSFPFGKVFKQEDKRFGRNHDIVTNWNYDEITLTMLVDSQGKILNLLRNWKYKIVNDEYKVHYYDDYVGELTISMLDNSLKSVYDAILRNAYPTSITDLALDYDSNGICQINVTFTYSHIDYVYNGKNYDVSVNAELERQVKEYAKTEPQNVNISFNPIVDLGKDILGQVGRGLSSGLTSLINQKVSGLNLTKLNKSFEVPIIGKIDVNVGTYLQGKVNQMAQSITSNLQNNINQKVDKLQTDLEKKYADKKTNALNRITQTINDTVTKIFNI